MLPPGTERTRGRGQSLSSSATEPLRASCALREGRVTFGLGCPAATRSSVHSSDRKESPSREGCQPGPRRLAWGPETRPALSPPLRPGTFCRAGFPGGVHRPCRPAWLFSGGCWIRLMERHDAKPKRTPVRAAWTPTLVPGGAEASVNRSPGCAARRPGRPEMRAWPRAGAPRGSHAALAFACDPQISGVLRAA